MLGHIFYHFTTAKYIAMFGNLFNDLVVRRFDSNSNELQSITVPISYSPKEKWLLLSETHPADSQVNVILPRLGFQITGWQHDPQRKVNPIHRLVYVTDDNNKMLAQYVPVPYKVQIELYALCKYMNDACQIWEQIIPFFNPDFNATLDLIPALDKKYDIRVNLTGSSQEDIFEGDFKTRRMIMQNFSFEIDCWFFAPIQTQGVIKRVQVDLHAVPGVGMISNEELSRTGRNVRIVVTPGLTSSGEPTSNSSLSIPYSQIDANDNYGFIEEHFFFDDGKRYSSIRGEDI